MRAVTSTVSNAAATIVIAKWEHACDEETLNAELRGGPPAEDQVMPPP